MAMITYDILFDDGCVSWGVATNIAAAARRAMRIAEREGIRVVSVSDRYARAAQGPAGGEARRVLRAREGDV